MQLELLSRFPKVLSDKPPLLFLHGMGFGAWCWEENFLPWFTRHGYPAYAMSLRGHGQSDGADKLKWTSLDSLVDDLAEIYHAFERPPVIIGHSMGGFIVQKFLADHDFTEGKTPPAVILLASLPSSGLLGIALRSMKRHPLASLKVMINGSARPLLSSPEILQDTLLSKDFPQDKALEIVQRTGDESFRAFLTLMFVSSPKRKPAQPPMLVISARDDAYISLADGENTAKYYHADHVVLPGLAHLVMLDSNWEHCADEIRQWLLKQGF